MENSGFKVGIFRSERKLLLFLGLCVLLVGIALIGKAHDGSFAPLVVLIGLFGVCLSVVKQHRNES